MATTAQPRAKKDKDAQKWARNLNLEEWMEKPDAKEGCPPGMEYFQDMQCVRLFNDGLYYETRLTSDKRQTKQEVAELERLAKVSENEKRRASIANKIEEVKRSASQEQEYIPEVDPNGQRQFQEKGSHKPDRKRKTSLLAALKGPMESAKPKKTPAPKAKAAPKKEGEATTPPVVHGQFCVTDPRNKIIIGKLLGSFEKEGDKAFLLDRDSHIIMTIENCVNEDGNLSGHELLVKDQMGEIMARVRQSGGMFIWRLHILTADKKQAYVLKANYAEAMFCPNFPLQKLSLFHVKENRKFDQQCIKTHDAYTHSDYFAITFPGRMDINLKAGLLAACILTDAGLWKPEHVFEADLDEAGLRRLKIAQDRLDANQRQREEYEDRQEVDVSMLLR